jgi:polyhydroxybutyrate depolymerase
MPIASAGKTRHVLLFGILCACDPTGVAPSPFEVQQEPPVATDTAPRRTGPQQPPLLAASTTSGRPTGAGASGSAPNDGVLGQGGGAALPALAGSPTSAADGSGSPGAGGSAGAANAGSAPAAATDGPSLGCAPGTPTLVSGSFDLDVGAELRRYDLVAPAASGAAAPLLIALHGYAMTAAEMAVMTGWSALAEQDGAVVVYPLGLGQPTSWNAGSCCGSSAARDDLAFIDRLLDELEAVACVDRARVYVAGFSNGGMLAERLACERSDRIAAVASVAGSLAIPLADCNPSEPVPVLHIHGTADPLVPYLGGRGSPLLTLLGSTPPTFPRVDTQLERFASLNGCSAAVETALESRDALCERRTDCADDARVELCTVLGGGHAWPAGVPPLLARGGAAAQTLPTSDVVWEFLSAQRL